MEHSGEPGRRRGRGMGGRPEELCRVEADPEGSQDPDRQGEGGRGAPGVRDLVGSTSSCGGLSSLPCAVCGFSLAS